MSSIALFDFDGTITRRDTTRTILLTAAARRPLRGMVYTLVLVFSRLLRSQDRFHRQKDVLLFSLLARMSDEEAEAVLESYRARVQPLLRASMLDRMKEYEGSGVRVLVVTASPQFAVERVFEDIRVSVLGATVAPLSSGDRKAGNVVVSCFGTHKVTRFQEWAQREGWQGDVVAAWSDSVTDLPLMQMAEHRYWTGPAGKADVFKAVDPEGMFVEVDD